MFIVRTRGFNHTGCRRGPVFVCSDFAKQVAEIEKGRRDPVIWVGNLDAIRDFTDVRDIVRGYWLALEHCDPGDVYNICSGVGRKIRDVLDMLIGMTSKSVEVKVDECRLRPSDVPVLIGDNTKFREKTGWELTIPFEITLKEIYEYWLERV